MATNALRMNAPPAVIFEILLDPTTYPDWVVGCQKIRQIDGDWPQPGSRFHHCVGAGPVQVADSTMIVAVDAPHRLEMEVRLRPVGVGALEFRLTPGDGGTLVTMDEVPTGGPFRMLHSVVQDRLISARNTESLRRLRRLAETRAAPVAP